MAIDAITDPQPAKPKAADFDVERVRRDFPALSLKVYGKPLAYLDNAATAQKPESVIEAEAAWYRETCANVHRGVHALSVRATAAYENARAKVQALRAMSDAVAVGIGTALADDPQLTVRDPDFEGRAPRRIVFDSSLRITDELRLVRTATDFSTTVITTPEASEERAQALIDLGVEIVRVAATAEGRVDVEAALRQLASDGVVSLLIEGGAELAGSAIAARLVNRAHVFIAPILLGPRGRPGAVDWAGPDRPEDAPRIVSPAWEQVGDDAYVSGELVFPS